MKKSLQVLLLVFGVLLGTAMVISVSSFARDNGLDSEARRVPYTGQLNLEGDAYEGRADLRFILQDQTNNTWTETHPDVDVTGGQFSVLLGDVEELPDWLFEVQEVTLAVSVRAEGEESFEELAGTQRLHPTAFAYWSAEADRFLVDRKLTVLGAATFTGEQATLSTLAVDGDVTFHDTWVPPAPERLGFATDSTASVHVTRSNGESWLNFEMQGEGDTVVLQNGASMLTIGADDIVVEGVLQIADGTTMHALGENDYNGFDSGALVEKSTKEVWSLNDEQLKIVDDASQWFCGLTRTRMDRRNRNSNFLFGIDYNDNDKAFVVARESGNISLGYARTAALCIR